MRSPLALSALLLSLAACSADAHDQVPAADASDAAYPDPADGGAVTWNSWVSGFSNYYCVSCHNPNAPCGGSGCHTPSDPALEAMLFDMRDESSWTSRSAVIRCGIATTQDPAWNCSVAPDTYPKDVAGFPMPTESARQFVVDWFDAGCP